MFLWQEDERHFGEEGMLLENIWRDECAVEYETTLQAPGRLKLQRIDVSTLILPTARLLHQSRH
jgi:hypothetical protein